MLLGLAGDRGAVSCVDEARSAGLRLALDGAPGRAGHRAQDRRTPRPEHAGFLAGDGGEAPAQEPLVVAGQAHDGRSQRLRDVGRVETPPHAHLEHGHVHSRAAEVVEGRGGQRLEVGGMRRDDAGGHEAFGGAADAAHRPVEGGVRDEPIVDGDPLVNAHEVGGGIAADAEARRPERGVDVGHDRPFAVGPGDEKRRVGAFGTSEGFGERPHRLEAELDAESDAGGEIGGGRPCAGARHPEESSGGGGRRRSCLEGCGTDSRRLADAGHELQRTRRR